MERFLIALDCMPGCLKIIDYMVRVLNGTQHFEFVIFHILPDRVSRQTENGRGSADRTQACGQA